jgi:hypothetical protein
MPTYTANEPKKQAIYFVEPDVYEVEIRKAIEKTSQSGNPMIKLICTIIMPDGTDGPEVWEHLTFTEKASWKIDQVLSAIGIGIVSGEEIDVEADQLVLKRGICLIGQEVGSENPDHRFNKIDRWFFGDEKKEWMSGKKTTPPPVKREMKSNVSVKSLDETDEIPF